MDSYVTFYMEGRSDMADDDVPTDIDLTALATRVLAGEDMYVVTQQVASAALSPRANSSAKRRWLKENADEIEDAGGDGDKAYQYFLRGQVAELRYVLEDETCNQIDEQLEDGEGDDPETFVEGENDPEGEIEMDDDEADKK